MSRISWRIGADAGVHWAVGVQDQCSRSTTNHPPRRPCLEQAQSGARGGTPRSTVDGDGSARR